jgi:hypothetical protein
LEIVSPGVDSSGGYDSTLTVILFDQDGQPFPWQATGNFKTKWKPLDEPGPEAGLDRTAYPKQA